MIFLQLRQVGLQKVGGLIPPPQIHQDPNDLDNVFVDAGHRYLLQAEASNGGHFVCHFTMGYLPVGRTGLETGQRVMWCILACQAMHLWSLW